MGNSQALTEELLLCENNSIAYKSAVLRSRIIIRTCIYYHDPNLSSSNSSEAAVPRPARLTFVSSFSDRAETSDAVATVHLRQPHKSASSFCFFLFYSFHTLLLTTTTRQL